MDQKLTARRTFLGLAAMTPFAAGALASCGSSGPGSTSSDAASLWYLSGDPNETIKTDTLQAWNDANPDSQIDVTFYQNDAYKTKIKTAIGAGEAPTMIYSWGGGTLRSYAEAEQVVDLTSFFDENAAVKDSVLASTFDAATVDGKIYALPNENASPIIFYYNKDLFDAAGAEPPVTWDDLMALVPVFNGMDVAPLALGGQSRWTSMMWLEYLFDRVGGPEVFTSIYDGEDDAWSNPAALQALTMIQDLVGANGFITGFESITADSNADQALLYTGKAAMMLHGSWTYAGMKNDGGDFVPSGKLGWVNFPTVTGGVGDPADVVGNPAQYMSISARATEAQQTIAKDYFTNGIMNSDVVDAYIASGQVCVAADAEDKIASSDDKDFLTYAYGLVKNAPAFAQSWDQALSPATSETLLSNIDQLFSNSVSPEQFAETMNGTLGQ